MFVCLLCKNVTADPSRCRTSRLTVYISEVQSSRIPEDGTYRLSRNEIKQNIYEGQRVNFGVELLSLRMTSVGE